ncbi:MAG TPA: M4 family metallopeptidase, partial [Roseiflexaceae bacterium]|nr:M4 family metallopeptidase [Roseiflexaceae bacterium]
MFRLRAVLSVLLALAASLALLPAAGLLAVGGPEEARDASIALLRQGRDRLVIYNDQQTGVPNFVAGELPAIKANVSEPVAVARAFFAENSSLFGMTNPQAELSVVRDERDAIGMHHVRFQQRYNGVDVFGAQIVAHLRGKQVTAIAGSYFPDIKVDTQPGLSLAQAVERARAEVGAPEAEVISAGSGLAIYAKDRGAALTWKVELLSMARPGRWLVFVNAHSGRIAHRINMLHTAKRRSTHIAGGTNHTTLPGTLVCSDVPAVPTCGDVAAQAAHDNAGKVYDYYFAKFGRDSIDGSGLIMTSTVHFDVDYNNAFWNGSQMVYGDGDGSLFSPLSQSLDVVAHELTHGVTDYTADLVYEDESGALNESYSDVLGVFADTFGRGSATVNWALGEDVWTPSIAGDALRDMADPHKGNDPFTNAYNCSYRPGQPFYCGQPASLSEFARLPISFFEEVPSDVGGVHVNSGIPNKAAYLLTEGGTFGGVTVAGIGITRTEQIYYRTLVHYLTPYSTFMAARNSSIQACTDLIGQFGIVAANCDSVRNAFAAVGVGSNTSFAHQLYLPTTSNNATLARGFTGQVTLNGAPVAGVGVQLRLCDDRKVSPCGTSVAQATTGADGMYVFPAGASLPNTDDHTWYRVMFINPSAQPNGRMLGWVGDDIGTYVQGDIRRLDGFDIGDVTYVSPNNTTPRSFPVTFTWNARPVGGEYYYWELYNQNFDDIIAYENP